MRPRSSGIYCVLLTSGSYSNFYGFSYGTVIGQYLANMCVAGP